MQKLSNKINNSKFILDKYGIEIDEYLKTEFEDIDFDDALKYDKRSFCQFFYERFKEKQIIINTFFKHENLKPTCIKIILLLINIDLYFVINGIFITEDYISELFNSNEEETFFSFFPRSISRFAYTTLVSGFLGIIIDCFFIIEEKKIKKVFIREKKDSIKLKYEISLIIKKIKKNYIIFIIICFLISLISWYYVSCFNNVYPGIKIEWIKSSITIIIIMQILSFFTALLESILRAISFKFNSEKIYRLKELI